MKYVGQRPETLPHVRFCGVVALSVSIRIIPISIEEKEGRKRSLSRPVPVMGVLVVYNLAADLEYVSTKVCW